MNANKFRSDELQIGDLILAINNIVLLIGLFNQLRPKLSETMPCFDTGPHRIVEMLALWIKNLQFWNTKYALKFIEFCTC